MAIAIADGVVLYATDGIELPKAGEHLDKLRKEVFPRFYNITRYHTGEVLRAVVEQLDGIWNCQKRPNGQYDTFNIPYEDGILIIERPWRGPRDQSLNGHHRVSFDGALSPGLEDSVVEFLDELHEMEREQNRQWFTKEFPKYEEEHRRTHNM